MNNSIKTLIVDDELNACKNLLKTLTDFSTAFNIIGYARNTREAKLLIQLHQPDLVFLDISMPLETGIEFLERIQPFNFSVVFITAHSDFALRAIKLEALDYILKPIDINDFRQCINKLEKKFDALPSDSILRNNQILIKSVDDVYMLEINSIIYMEAKGAYVAIYYWDCQKVKTIFSSKNIGFYEESLTALDFIRPHKSFLTQKKKVKKIINNITNPQLLLEHDCIIPIALKKKSSIIKQINF